MTSKTLVAELLLDARATIGEGPVWDARGQRLLWVDIPNHHVHRFDPASGATATLDLGQPVGSVVPGADGGLVAALRDGFGIIPPGGDRVREIIAVERDKPDNRMNDGKCDCRGRFWAGTMAVDLRPGAGTLYRFERAGDGFAATPMLAGVSVANGLDWSLDNKRMYYIDSPTRRIDLFDFDAGAGGLSGRRPFVEIPAADGTPDGMTLDAEGYLWVALFGGGKVRRYAPDATIDREVTVPATLVTSCAFGGPGLRSLYITTAKHRLTPEEAARQTAAGGLFVCEPGPVGRLPFLFGRTG
jgi:sugar lactone lactonase YvrE